MVSHRLAGAPLDFAALRSELAVPGEFSSTALAEAERAAARPILPDEDRTDLPFVTVDPAGSRDLDQAVHIEKLPTGQGFLVSYAIADIAAFVTPGTVLDTEVRRRGETLYFPDARVPLHPPVLSEGAASLLPGQPRPAVLWQLRLDSSGEVIDIDVRRARVRSTAQLDYPGLQRALQSEGPVPDAVVALPEVGRLRQRIARSRHAIDLDLPEQDVEADGPGGWRIVTREPLPVEQFNAQISLLTGMCAAEVMLAGGYGILRTVPPPDERAVAALRRVAPALGVEWSPDAAPGDVLARIDRGNPRQVAFLDHAVSLLRGSGYTVFDGVAPEQRLHAGVGAPYTHVTAPIRRLVDRYAAEICLAQQAERPIPDWVREALPTLPQLMQVADRRAHEADRAVVDATEAWLLRDRVGETFDALVLSADDHHGTIALDSPLVRARCEGALQPGERIVARLVAADVPSRTARFERVQL